jgi:type II secretory pathway component GspD/PulD (secretin)
VSIRQTIGSLVLASLGLPAVANAQERQVTAAYRDADVRTVIQQVGQLTESVVVIGKGVEGSVTFQPNGPMTVDEFRRAFLAHLVDLGYEVSDRNGVLLIGPIKP